MSNDVDQLARGVGIRNQPFVDELAQVGECGGEFDEEIFWYVRAVFLQEEHLCNPKGNQKFVYSHSTILGLLPCANRFTYL